MTKQKKVKSKYFKAEHNPELGWVVLARKKYAKEMTRPEEIFQQTSQLEFSSLIGLPSISRAEAKHILLVMDWAYERGKESRATFLAAVNFIPTGIPPEIQLTADEMWSLIGDDSPLAMRLDEPEPTEVW